MTQQPDERDPRDEPFPNEPTVDDPGLRASGADEGGEPAELPREGEAQDGDGGIER
jgi:hypothetical protein